MATTTRTQRRYDPFLLNAYRWHRCATDRRCRVANRAVRTVFQMVSGRRSRRAGSQELGTLLLAVLARYGITGLESEVEAQGPIAAESDTST